MSKAKDSDGRVKLDGEVSTGVRPLMVDHRWKHRAERAEKIVAAFAGALMLTDTAKGSAYMCVVTDELAQEAREIYKRLHDPAR